MKAGPVNWNIEQFIMKSNKLKTTVSGILAGAALGWLCWGAGALCNAQTPPANLSPDLQEVVRLSQQKMSDEVITNYIRNSGKSYKLGADDIIYLSSQGVSQGVLGVLLQGASAGGASAVQTPPPAAPATSTATAAASGPVPPPLDATPSPAPAPAPTPMVAPPSYPAPSLAPGPVVAPAPAGFQDNFFAEGGLNPGLWTFQSGVLSSLAAMHGSQVLPALTFTPSGLQMSGVRGPGQFMGIQSTAAFAAPFTFSATVSGLEQYGVPFEIYLVSGDLQQWVSVAGHLGGRGGPRGGIEVGGGMHHLFGEVRIPVGGSSPEHGVWINHTGNGQPISALGNKVFEDPIAGLAYTVQINLGADGMAAVTFMDAAHMVLAAQSVPAGRGPFYVVLAGRDGPTLASWQSAQLLPATPVVAAPEVAPAPAVPAVPTMEYFQAQLTPYGNWVTLPEYGLCWQPAVAPGWRPYYDGGAWTYTDAGWYWQSEYPWGDIPFHYGRWAFTAAGWVWVPGYDYAPAWVVWRHADADGYLGWAPLVPGAVFVDGGWMFHGAHVAADFDFGIGAGFFTFVASDHFWEHDFRRFVVPHDRVEFVFGHSVFENHFRMEHGIFINEGLGRDRMALLTHRDVREIEVRHVEEIRHSEEQHNIMARRDDVRDFRPGAKPDARGFHGPEERRDNAPLDRGGDRGNAGPGRGPAGAPAAAAGKAPAATPGAGAKGAAPAASGKGGSPTDKKSNGN